jgi:hypothetical protein
MAVSWREIRSEIASAGYILSTSYETIAEHVYCHMLHTHLQKRIQQRHTIVRDMVCASSADDRVYFGP